MNDKNIENVFQMFSGMHPICCQSFITDAKRTVYGMTKPECRNNLFLDFLTASIACADWKRTHNIVCDEKDKYSDVDVQLSEILVSRYMNLCSELLKEGDEHGQAEAD